MDNHGCLSFSIVLRERVGMVGWGLRTINMSMRIEHLKHKLSGLSCYCDVSLLSLIMWIDLNTWFAACERFTNIVFSR